VMFKMHIEIDNLSQNINRFKIVIYKPCVYYYEVIIHRYVTILKFRFLDPLYCTSPHNNDPAHVLIEIIQK